MLCWRPPMNFMFFYVAKIVIAIAHGIPASPAQTERSVRKRRFLEAICAITYQYVSFQREAWRGRQLVHDMITKPIEYVKRNMEAGTAQPSFTHTLLALPQNEFPELDRRIPWVSSTMFNAGADTTYATVLSFVLTMALNPEKQKLAQAQIDPVIGEGRLPALKDREDLPYVNGMLKETMRWLPVVPMGERVIPNHFRVRKIGFSR
ncbi:cytochrome P450 [Obba rivulosa]|uniref:Cytochrome P450 n=1 Tax=Obba rivulosa TaxID=1052685 RepID=A0A8E2DHF2_9APHY|nr:cytochrome P450 [Obba rivulosa]